MSDLRSEVCACPISDKIVLKIISNTSVITCPMREEYVKSNLHRNNSYYRENFGLEQTGLKVV